MPKLFIQIDLIGENPSKNSEFSIFSRFGWVGTGRGALRAEDSHSFSLRQSGLILCKPIAEKFAVSKVSESRPGHPALARSGVRGLPGLRIETWGTLHPAWNMVALCGD